MLTNLRSNSTQPLDNLTGPVRYGLTNDYMFRAVFQNSEEALRHLLSALLDIPYEDILSCEIRNPIVLGETIDVKTCVLDIRLLLNHNRLINLEMQTGHLKHWANRSLYYLARLYCNIRRGEDYSSIMPALHIGILTGSPFQEYRRFYSRYFMAEEETGHIFSRNFCACVLDLSQLENVPIEERDSELYNWAKFFQATTWEEICMLSREKDYLSAAAVNLYTLSEEEKIQLQCEARERYYMDMNTYRVEGIEQGIQQGIQQGIEQGISRINELNQRLVTDGRFDELKRSLSDPDLQQNLLKEYGLVTAK